MAMGGRGLEEAAHHVAIGTLLAAYADAVGRRAWGELAELFLPDAVVDVVPLYVPPVSLVGPEALGRFIEGAIERFDFFQFEFLNTAVRVAPDGLAARGRNTICEHRRNRETTVWEQSYGVYHDAYRNLDGRWWFERRSFSPLGISGGDNRVYEFPADFADHLSEPW